MDLFRYSHSCVRIERGGQVLVIDPGVWSEPEALRGADAVLITHEHYDHVDELRLVGLGTPVYAPAAARLHRLETIPVSPGQTFDAAGFSITAEGGEHARVLPGQAPVANVGYRIEDALYHPGDSLTPCSAPVRTLLAPIQASWLRTADVVTFIATVDPEIALGIHDGQLNDRGLQAVNSWLEKECGPRYRWSPPNTGQPTPTHSFYVS